MNTSPNPFTGSSWTSNPNPGMLAGWMGQNINPPPPPGSGIPGSTAATPTGTSVLPPTTPFQTPSTSTTPNGNPGNLPNPTSNLKDIFRNAGFDNVTTGQFRNDLIPLFANMMFGAGTSAKDFFTKLMDLGSPYYQQEQEAGFNQGVTQNNNAGATAREELASSGYGATPSGATAGMIGGMNIAGSQNLATQFLQTLFNNQNMQLQGAQGLAALAQLFNPANLTGQNTTVSGTTQGPSAADQVASIIGSLFGSGGVSSLNSPPQ